MDIKQAKEEIRRTVLAYTERDALGALRIPMVRQRPLLLMGPPGVGKTAIFYQLAQELGVNLVSYTMTHHTRQSAGPSGAPGKDVRRESLHRDRVHDERNFSQRL